jgi:hypothetical protein
MCKKFVLLHGVIAHVVRRGGAKKFTTTIIQIVNWRFGGLL